jgi:hypothetical protein
MVAWHQLARVDERTPGPRGQHRDDLVHDEPPALLDGPDRQVQIDRQRAVGEERIALSPSAPVVGRLTAKEEEVEVAGAVETHVVEVAPPSGPIGVRVDGLIEVADAEIVKHIERVLAASLEPAILGASPLRNVAAEAIARPVPEHLESAASLRPVVDGHVPDHVGVRDRHVEAVIRVAPRDVLDEALAPADDHRKAVRAELARAYAIRVGTATRVPVDGEHFRAVRPPPVLVREDADDLVVARAAAGAGRHPHAASVTAAANLHIPHRVAVSRDDDVRIPAVADPHLLDEVVVAGNLNPSMRRLLDLHPPDLDVVSRDPDERAPVSGVGWTVGVAVAVEIPVLEADAADHHRLPRGAFEDDRLGRRPRAREHVLATRGHLEDAAPDTDQVAGHDHVGSRLDRGVRGPVPPGAVPGLDRVERARVLESPINVEDSTRLAVSRADDRERGDSSAGEHEQTDSLRLQDSFSLPVRGLERDPVEPDLCLTDVAIEGLTSSPA